MEKTRGAGNVVLAKLGQGAHLSASDKDAVLHGLAGTKPVAAGANLTYEGDPPNGVVVVVEGLVSRYKDVGDGGRQIVALLLPGDFCDVNAGMFKEMDHGLATLTPSRLAIIQRPLFEAWMCSAAIRKAVNWAALVDAAILREWLVNLGSRPAPERMAHLFCEIQARLRAVDASIGADTFKLPMTQAALGETLGLSVVHINRVLNQLRRAELMTHKRGLVTIPDQGRLAAFAGFRDNYLHLHLQTAA